MSNPYPLLLLETKKGTKLGSSLVPNGNMETGSPPSEWIPATGTPVLTSVADERPGGAGTKALDVAVNTGEANGSALNAITLEVGKTYRLEGWVKNINATKVILIVYSGAFNVMAIIDNITATAWTKYSTDFVCTEATGTIAITVIGTQTKHAEVDDVTIRKILNP